MSGCASCLADTATAKKLLALLRQPQWGMLVLPRSTSSRIRSAIYDPQHHSQPAEDGCIAIYNRRFQHCEVGLGVLELESHGQTKPMSSQHSSAYALWPYGQGSRKC